jgi:isopentenyl-diphosphate delta-isomerase
MTKNVILVDTADNVIGEMSKLEVHQKGLLHRAFSIFIFNSNGQIVMQQRALHKYHSGGLWSNTCCSHAAPGEILQETAHARLKEEMGMSCNLMATIKFIYKVQCNNGLIEHEYDQIFLGYTDETPIINTDEVSDWKYMSIDELLNDLETNALQYTTWLKPCLTELLNYLKKQALKTVYQ